MRDGGRPSLEYQKCNTMKRFRAMPEGIRGYRTPRCPRCWMEQKECICSSIPDVWTSTRVIVIMPWKESGRSSNTGRLVSLALGNSEVRLRGKPGHPLDLEDLAPVASTGLLLYPGENSRLLEPSMLTGDGPVSLVVPDGTWRQASRITRGEPALRGFTQVHLPQGPESIYTLRKQRGPGRLCTFEAVAMALDIIEGPGIADKLMPALQAMITGTMRSRGKSR